MTKEEYLWLVEKIADGTANDAEMSLYNAYFEAFQKSEEGDAHMGLNIQMLEKESLERFYRNIKPIKSLRLKLWSRMAVAASVAIVIGTGMWIYHISQPDGKIFHPQAYNHDIAPGKNGAMVTLANGKTIKLSRSKTAVVIDATKLTYGDGSYAATMSTGSTSPQLMIVSTPKGGTYQVVLPDGTKVWMNAASSLKFPSTFNGATERNIELSGEAYFEVAKVLIKDKLAGHARRMPFVVKSLGQQVSVLGTHFNVNAYGDDIVLKTTLLEGSVRVLNLKSHASNLLRPGQQSELKGGVLQVLNVDPTEAIAWKNGLFIFNDEPLEDIMRKISRWYDVEVIYDHGVDKKQRFGGGISRYEHVSSVLRKLEITEGVHFKVEERRIIVTQ